MAGSVGQEKPHEDSHFQKQDSHHEYIHGVNSERAMSVLQWGKCSCVEVALVTSLALAG
jgi:hypothetical protein